MSKFADLARLFGFCLLVLFEEASELAIVVTFRQFHRHDVLQLLLEGEKVLLEDFLVSDELIDIFHVLFNLTFRSVLNL